MNDKTKGFFRGVLTVLGAIASLGLYFLFRKRPSVAGGQGSAPSEIAKVAERKIEETRQEIHADSDEELAARFNSLAKKEEKKS